MLRPCSSPAAPPPPAAALGEPHFAHGMCRTCFLHFCEATGGLFAGANPPAFEAARAREAAEAEQAELLALEGGGEWFSFQHWLSKAIVEP